MRFVSLKQRTARRTLLGDEGFSLVELIIVIAIMAILVGIVGTQVIPYLERSRRAKDYQVFSGWNTAGMSAYSMNADKLDAAETYEIVIDDSGISCADDGLDGAADLIATFCEMAGLEETKSNQIADAVTSREGKLVKMVKITIPVANNVNNQIITRIYTDTAGTNESDSFERIENR